MYFLQAIDVPIHIGCTSLRNGTDREIEKSFNSIESSTIHLLCVFAQLVQCGLFADS
jgi:hypothetical protein